MKLTRALVAIDKVVGDVAYLELLHAKGDLHKAGDIGLQPFAENRIGGGIEDGAEDLPLLLHVVEKVKDDMAAIQDGFMGEVMPLLFLKMDGEDVMENVVADLV